VGFSDDVEEILIPTVREVRLAGLGVKLWCSSDELRCMLLQDDEQEVKGGKGVEVKTRPKLSVSTSTPGF
jgi:hypothetical protein